MASPARMCARCTLSPKRKPRIAVGFEFAVRFAVHVLPFVFGFFRRQRASQVTRRHADSLGTRETLTRSSLLA